MGGTVTLHPDQIAQVAFLPVVQQQVRAVGERIVTAAQWIAEREAYDSGAYHDSMHVEPDYGVLPNGSVLAVAGGAVRPRFAPRAGVTRGPDVDYAAILEVSGTGSGSGRHIMRRAAEAATARGPA